VETWTEQRKRLEDCLPSLGNEPIGQAIAEALRRLDLLQGFAADVQGIVGAPDLASHSDVEIEGEPV